MGLKSTIKAGAEIYKKYGFVSFIKQMVCKYSKHNFEKADDFLNRKQEVTCEKFSPQFGKVDGLVSVVIPCYNHESFVADALYSIYNQTYSSIEIVLIDDCSKDKSYEIVKMLFDRWQAEGGFYKLTLLKNPENKGAHYSINKGLNLACGQYITVLNSDDIYGDNRFDELINLMNDKSASLAFSKVEEIDEDGMIKKKTPFSSLQKGIDIDHMFLGLCGDNLAISSGNLFFKRDIIEEIGLFRDFKYIHDWDFLLRSAIAFKIVFTDQTCYYYRMHSTNSYLALNSMTDLCDGEMLEMRSRVFSKVYNQKESKFYDQNEYNQIIDLLYRRMINNSRK